MAHMVARLRIILVAVVVLTFTRIAYAQDINIRIQGDPFKASPMEARKQYLRGREADEMVRKGYVCYREVGTTECSWAKPERTERAERAMKAHWGKCLQVRLPLNGRICERIAPHTDGSSYYDFERPLVLLVEKIQDARIMAESDNPFFPGDATRDLRVLQTAFLKMGTDIEKRSTYEQRKVLHAHFGPEMDKAFRKVDPEGYKAALAAHAKEAAEGAESKSAPVPDAMPAKALEPNKPAMDKEPAADKERAVDKELRGGFSI